jgi:predicted nucleic acid-binding protein
LSQIIVDASVVAKWVLPGIHEPLADEASELLVQYVDGKIQLVVPDLFWAEMGNFLWKAARTRRCDLSDAQMGLAELSKYRITTISTKPHLDFAFVIATAFDRSVYDSLYVALAVSFKSHLVTADEKLANALAAHLPVKWLGAYF